MTTARRVILYGASLSMAAASPGHAQGVFRDVVRGLEYSGFQFVGAENPLSGGADFSLSRNFTGQTLDFGATELTLTGPILFTFSTGGRGLPVLDFSLNTNDQAFEYVFETSTGAQDMRVEGNVLVDATGSINTFGFYDLRLQLSSRQNVFLDGRFQNNVEQHQDFDLGPIDVSGNLFADVLARVFDPFFQATGTENIFDSFSGRGQREDLLQQLVADAQAKLAAGKALTAEEAARLLGYGDAFAMLGDRVPDLSFVNDAFANGQVVFTPVPEPGLLVLLLGPAAYLIARRRR